MPAARGQRLPSIGLSLSGGGLAGGGAMTGFACALDLFLGGHRVGDLASYSGVSAGAIIAAYLAAGVSPHDICRGHHRPGQGAFVPFKRSDLYQPNWRELPTSLWRAGTAALTAVRRRRNGASGEQASGPRDTLGIMPSGAFSSDRLEATIRANLERRGANRFAAMPARLRVVFYDLVSNQRLVAGTDPGDLNDMPVSEAVTASAAIPGIFPPRRIVVDGQTLLGVDGGTASLTLDVPQQPVEVLFAYNHMGYTEPAGVQHISALSVLSLSRQLLWNQRNRDEIAAYMDAHPDCHVWLFESPPASLRSLMSYAAMLARARDAYVSTQDWLRRHLDYFGLMLERCGVAVDPSFNRVRFDDILAHGDAVRRRAEPAATPARPFQQPSR